MAVSARGKNGVNPSLTIDAAGVIFRAEPARPESGSTLFFGVMIITPSGSVLERVLASQPRKKAMFSPAIKVKI